MRFLQDAIRAPDGLAIRGAFHPVVGDGVPPFDDGAAPGTLVMLGLVGRQGWEAFAASPEARDGEPNPLDRWSARLVAALARRLGARPLFPFGGPPWWPIQRWAMRAEPVFASPLGILIHPDWGLWHSYRGALLLREALPLRPQPNRASPCESCVAKPCLAACPVGAFSDAGYDVAACVGHLSAGEGRECRDGGCLARRACPVGVEHRYGAAQAAFHMRAFTTAHAPPPARKVGR